MRLGELITLVHQLDPKLKLAFDTTPMTPISGMSVSEDRLLLHAATQTPLTVETFRRHATHFDQHLTIFDSSGKRLYGFRQSKQWLLFK